ncbi:MAG: histidine--tRNA ligase [Phycisphaerae bacterium]|nr:histidine--tRNA ligase [Phycisphaerae bacterium]
MGYQAPKGTRDFFPDDLAVLRHIERAWRDASINSGFEEIEGPTFEHLDLYTVKSGDGIVSELFSFKRTGGDVDYALRPEFTPTLARMAAAKGRSLSVPTKWFAIPNHFRAERPQRGRLREFTQWNVDLLGIDNPSADAEVIATAIHALAALGLTSADVVVRISHREVVVSMLRHAGITEDKLDIALTLLDKREKMSPDVFAEKLSEHGLDKNAFKQFDDDVSIEHEELTSLQKELDAWGIREWCSFDFNIVRGLAYYTGIVFEIHERSGAERAIAGGGRYNKLVGMFGGPEVPAAGFGMGDVVLSLVLKDKGLLDDGSGYLESPDVFVVSACDEGDAIISSIIAELRTDGIHARRSYKTTRNVGKLLTEAGKTNTRFTVILGQELEQGCVVVKNMESGDQVELPREQLLSHVAP